MASAGRFIEVISDDAIATGKPARVVGQWQVAALNGG
jgi:hypothetical protein